MTNAAPQFPLPGFFLSFEGSEGCGKSTQIRLLKARLEAGGCSVEVLREPGGTQVGEEIRHLLQHAKAGEGMTPEAELLLFAASRAQIVREKIRPLLEEGAFVILDRFLDSTTVYQGMARGLPLESVRAINAFATGGTLPELTLVLDMDPATAHQRIHATGRELDRMESQPLAFFEKVRQGYRQLAEAEPQRLTLVDADRPPETIHAEIWTLIQARRHAV
ncbi:dTMP kinase [Prosthecobacter fusiformis]|uniref:Thymidylate kinase n=1 Tax=Prosthecobacter fusiformis TaxID=48464 RepID=A0A4R7RR30_9BACT|nr:dTMP kinase [Prosthecobacter fusiformis]TDU67255.1 dTMP kinase [Prosthecobacter fusiformis]